MSAALVTSALLRAPLIDSRGCVSREWTQWFVGIQEKAGGSIILAPGNYGGPARAATITVNADGFVATITDEPIAIDASQVVSGVLASTHMPALSGDVSSSAGGTITTLATVNSAPGTYGSASRSAVVSVNGKGLVGVASDVSIAITAAQVAGTSTNDNAAAGDIGEFITATSSVQSLTSGTTLSLTSISLTAGDWDITGQMTYSPDTTTSITLCTQGTGTSPPSFTSESINPVPGVVNALLSFPLPTARYSLAATTTIYLMARATFTVSTLQAVGIIRARRMR